MTDAAWLSAHLYFSGDLYSTDGDEIVLSTVQPFVRHCLEQEWVQRFFYIRYSIPEPHVRLRMSGHPSTLRRQVHPALIHHLQLHYPGMSVRSGQGMDPAVKEPNASYGKVGVLSFVPYEPEYDRYGGTEGVTLAEDVFQLSSEVAWGLLEAVKPGDRSSRLGKGLLAMEVLIHAYHDSRTEAADFAHRYATGYLTTLAGSEAEKAVWRQRFDAGYEKQNRMLVGYVNEVWVGLEEGMSLGTALNGYVVGLGTLREQLLRLVEDGLLRKGGSRIHDWSEAVWRIVPSYMHMMSNRLGILIPEESYLAHLIHRALRAPVPS